MTHVILNGALVRANKAAIAVADRGFRYGDGVYETIAVNDGVPYQFEWHMKRLAAGLKAIRIRFDTINLQRDCRKLLKKNRCENGLLRIQITRGSGGRGYLPEVQASPTLLIETLPPSEIPKKSVSLWLSGQRKISHKALPVRYKLTQGLSSTLARLEAMEHGCFDALLLDENERVAETSSANIFWVKEGALYTPSLDCDVLEGSVRAALLRLCEAQETEAVLEILRKADAVFITNCAWNILPVGALQPDFMQWNSHAHIDSYRQALERDREEYIAAHRGQWR